MSESRREPEVALAFTPDPWVEELHRHLTDHGGARVRSVVVEAGVALEESYDVLIAGHRWPALTRALVSDVQARGRTVLGVYDREEPASRAHLVALGVDTVVESDASVETWVRAILETAGNRHDRSVLAIDAVAPRAGRLVVVGGAPGVGRTEVSIQLAVSLARLASVALLDADDVAPAVAARLHLPVEPNLSTAIDAVEHGRGLLDDCVLDDARCGCLVLGGVPNARAWTQMRPGEVLRVVDRLADAVDIVVADGAGLLEDVGGSTTRGRFATARALVGEADAIVGVCDAAPHGIARFLAWLVEAMPLAPEVPVVVVVNRAPAARFRRGEIYDELAASAPIHGVVFVGSDGRVADAAWDGVPVPIGPFTRSLDRVAALVCALPRATRPTTVLEAVS